MIGDKTEPSTENSTVEEAVVAILGGVWILIPRIQFGPLSQTVHPLANKLYARNLLNHRCQLSLSLLSYWLCHASSLKHS